eukprot:6996826-Pyramimonas_sp.AAC.1
MLGVLKHPEGHPEGIQRNPWETKRLQHPEESWGIWKNRCGPWERIHRTHLEGEGPGESSGILGTPEAT